MICNIGMLDVIWFLLLLASYSVILGDAGVPLRAGEEKGSFHLHHHCLVMVSMFIPSIYLYAWPLFISPLTRLYPSATVMTHMLTTTPTSAQIYTLKKQKIVSNEEG